MRIQGVVSYFSTDGYDRVLGVFLGEKIIFLNYIQFNEYLEPGAVSRYMSVGEHVDFEVFLNLARVVEKVNEGVSVFQGIVGSPDTLVMGSVCKVLGPDCCVLEVDDWGQLKIEIERPVNFSEGERVCFVGELAVIQE